MQEKNILNKYKKLLGQYCAINQFVELTKRCFVSEHADEIKSKERFVSLATQRSITLTEYDSERIVDLISKSYIVNIHLCFETFLKELCLLLHKYGKTEFTEKNQEDSWLKCAVKNIFPKGTPQEIKALVDICEYYRLIRNSSVHDLCNIDNRTKEFIGLSKYNFKTDAKFKKLSAPNNFEQISYDDFIMFARSTLELAEYLFKNVSYDYTKIISCAPSSVQSKWKKFSQKRREQAICAYIKSNYKINTSLEEQLPYLANKIMAQ